MKDWLFSGGKENGQSEMEPSCDYAHLPVEELAAKFIDFGVDDFLALAIAGKYKATYTAGPYTPDELTDQINHLITNEVNAAVNALMNEGRCELTVDDKGDFHVGPA